MVEIIFFNYWNLNLFWETYEIGSFSMVIINGSRNWILLLRFEAIANQFIHKCVIHWHSQIMRLCNHLDIYYVIIGSLFNVQPLLLLLSMYIIMICFGFVSSGWYRYIYTNCRWQFNISWIIHIACRGDDWPFAGQNIFNK